MSPLDPTDDELRDLDVYADGLVWRDASEGHVVPDAVVRARLDTLRTLGSLAVDAGRRAA